MKRWLLARRRLAIWTVVAGVSLAAVYLIGMQIFLGTRALRNMVTGDGESILLDYSSAHSWMPGRVQVKNLKLRGKDSNVEWLLLIDEAELRVDLLDAFHHRFHVTRVRGSGVSFVLRRLLEKEEATPERLASIPQIEGLETVPLAPPAQPPISDASYDLWTVQVENIVADAVREIWIDEYRFQGLATMTGGFYLRPARLAYVTPSRCLIADGAITRHGDTVLADVRGRVDASVLPFDPRGLQGADVFRALAADAVMDARVTDLGFTRRYLDPSETSLTGGAGRLHVDARFVGGEIRAGSAATAELARVAFSRDAVSATLDTLIEASVTDGGAQIHALAKDAALHVKGFDQPLVSTANAQGLVASANRNVYEPFDLRNVAGDVPAADIVDARAINGLLTSHADFGVDAGRGTLHGHFEVDLAGNAAKGLLAVALSYAAVRLENVHANGAVSVRANIHGWDTKSVSVDLGASDIEATNIVVETPHDKGGPAVGRWWGTMSFPSLRVAMGASPHAEMGLALRARDARPALAWFEAQGELPPWAGGFLTMDGLQMSAVLRVGAGFVDIRNLVAAAKNVDVRTTLAKRGDAVNGAVLVETKAKSVGVDLHDGTSSLILLGATAWYDHRSRGIPLATAPTPATPPRPATSPTSLRH